MYCKSRDSIGSLLIQVRMSAEVIGECSAIVLDGLCFFSAYYSILLFLTIIPIILFISPIILLKENFIGYTGIITESST